MADEMTVWQFFFPSSNSYTTELPPKEVEPLLDAIRRAWSTNSDFMIEVTNPTGHQTLINARFIVMMRDLGAPDERTIERAGQGWRHDG